MEEELSTEKMAHITIIPPIMEFTILIFKYWLIPNYVNERIIGCWFLVNKIKEILFEL